MQNDPKPGACTHALNMALYAQDAFETDQPWEWWEHRHPMLRSTWTVCIEHPRWNSAWEYRRKPRTIKIGDVDVPEPLRVAPDEGTRYFVPDILGLQFLMAWDGGSFDQRALANGLVHLTREAAELHVEALLSLSRPTEPGSTP